MSKKKFTAGLESIFTAIEDEVVEHYNQSPAVETETVETVYVTAKPKRGGKDFSADLGSAMQDAFVTTEDTYLSQEETNINLSDMSKKTMRKPLTGLDALLRRTIESSELDNEMKRRIVLIIESGQFEKLKSIAREESTLLKDIIERSVNYFIDDYERRKAIG